MSANSNFGKFCLFVSNWLSMATFGYHFTTINPSIPSLKTAFNQTYINRYGIAMPKLTETAVITLAASFTVLGSLLGGIVCRFLLLVWSRKRVLQFAHVQLLLAVVLMALVTGITKSYETFILGRFVLGLSIGQGFVLVPILTAETCSKNSQVLWQSGNGTAIVGGLVIALALGNPLALGNLDYWPVLIGLGAFPSILYLISSYWFTETPYYLLRNQKEEKAFDALKMLRNGSKDEIKKEITEIQGEIKEIEQVGMKEILTTPHYRKQLFAMFAVYANTQITGFNSISIYSDLMFIEAGVPADKVTYASLGVFVLGFIFGILGIYLGPYAMMIWLGFAIFFLVYFVVCLPPVKGKTPEEILEIFKGNHTAPNKTLLEQQTKKM
ncbi:solute carrier family 2, facilitated glucose transporter member 7-like [Ciona intestinalis]